MTKKNTNVLALDTSTSRLSLAVMKDGGILSETAREVKTGHAGIILEVIDTVLEEGGLKREEIGCIAVGTGPGSFTGLRIGLATAKGLGAALGCAVVGIPSLDAIARAVPASAMGIMPVIDAKKGEVFCALYSGDGARSTEFMNLKPEAVASLIREETLFLGNGCELYRDRLRADLGGLYHEGPQDLWHPRASVLAAMALQIRSEGIAGDVQPIYVRASDATLLLERSGKRV